jgi:hypothetical protein
LTSCNLTAVTVLPTCCSTSCFRPWSCPCSALPAATLSESALSQGDVTFPPHTLHQALHLWLFSPPHWALIALTAIVAMDFRRTSRTDAPGHFVLPLLPLPLLPWPHAPTSEHAVASMHALRVRALAGPRRCHVF